MGGMIFRAGFVSRYILQVFCKNNLDGAWFPVKSGRSRCAPMKLDSDTQIQVLHSGRKRDNI